MHLVQVKYLAKCQLCIGQVLLYGLTLVCFLSSCGDVSEFNVASPIGIRLAVTDPSFGIPIREPGSDQVQLVREVVLYRSPDGVLIDDRGRSVGLVAINIPIDASELRFGEMGEVVCVEDGNDVALGTLEIIVGDPDLPSHLRDPSKHELGKLAQSEGYEQRPISPADMFIYYRLER